MRKLTAIFVTALFALSVAQFAVANKKVAAPPDEPKYHSADQLNKYDALADEGYDAAREKNYTLALEKFTSQHEMFPAATQGAYNLACTFSLMGDNAKALDWVEVSIKNGFDKPGNLANDPDLAALQEEARMKAAIEGATENEKAGLARLAYGLPKIENLEVSFTDEDELKAWVDSQAKTAKQNRSVWTGSEYTAARLHIEAKRLAAMAKMKANDPEYDAGLERVKALAGLKSQWDTWGPLSNAVVMEARAYLTSGPSAAGMAAANYCAGLAQALKYGDDDTDASTRAETLASAEEYFSKVPESSEYAGQATAWKLATKLDAAGNNRESVWPEIKAAVEKYGDDEKARYVMGVHYLEDVAHAVWPIPIKMNDIDGKLVTIDEYKGKVLLIDFWATWCGPCLAELPTVRQVYEKYHPQGLEIVSISLDYDDRKPLEQYREWINDNRMTWRHIYDGKGWDAELAERYFVKSIPSPFLVGRDGSLVAMGNDCFGEKLEQSVKNALASR